LHCLNKRGTGRCCVFGMYYFLSHALSSIVLHKSILPSCSLGSKLLFHAPAARRGLDHFGRKSAISTFAQSTSWVPRKRPDLTSSSASALKYLSRPGMYFGFTSILAISLPSVS